MNSESDFVKNFMLSSVLSCFEVYCPIFGNIIYTRARRIEQKNNNWHKTYQASAVYYCIRKTFCRKCLQLTFFSAKSGLKNFFKWLFSSYKISNFIAKLNSYWMKFFSWLQRILQVQFFQLILKALQ